MTDEWFRWIAEIAIAFDALVFVLPGRHGSQPVLFPRSLYGPAATLHTV